MCQNWRDSCAWVPAKDMEEAMVMEAMRLSLLEHEEQQRKQAEEEKKKKAAAAAGLSAATAPASTSSPSNSNNSPTASSPGQPMTGAARSVLDEPRLRAAVVQTEHRQRFRCRRPRPPIGTVDPASLGLSQTTMDELRELIDEGPSPSGASARRSVPAPAPVPVPQPVAALGSVLSEQHDTSIGSQHGYPSPPPETGPDATKHATTYSTTTAHFGGDTSAPASPGSSGFAAVPRSRIINPNNPFRRSMGEQHH